MKFFLSVFFFIASTSALRCTNYAQNIGNMPAVNSVAWRAALRSVSGILGLEISLTCNPGEKCVSDIYHYTNDHGQTAGLVWTSCWAYGKRLTADIECHSNRFTDVLYNGFIEQRYRCICETDDCTNSASLHSMYKTVYGKLN